MPGLISDDYDPEFGVHRGELDSQLEVVYKKVSKILQDAQPIWILELINKDLTLEITADLTEKEWRLLRFAVERARDSL